MWIYYNILKYISNQISQKDSNTHVMDSTYIHSDLNNEQSFIPTLRVARLKIHHLLAESSRGSKHECNTLWASLDLAAVHWTVWHVRTPQNTCFNVFAKPYSLAEQRLYTPHQGIGTNSTKVLSKIIG